MKYLVRSIKYFAYLSIILTLMIFILARMNLVDGDLSTMFVNGYDSLWQIAAIMAVFSLIYPRFGYTSRSVHIPGETFEIRPAVIKVMDSRGYRLSKEDGENLTFVKRAPLDRLVRQFEDTVTLSRTAFGYDVEGRAKDVVRIAGSLESDEI